jgi:pSer/pThr/pTyr-binding forkhead associated (FHA) protein
MSIAVRIGEQVIVGRDVKADVRLADARVSRKHVALTWEGNGWTIRDLGATTPTLLLDPSGSSKELLGVSSVPSGQLLVGDVLVTLFPAT